MATPRFDVLVRVTAPMRTRLTYDHVVVVHDGAFQGFLERERNNMLHGPMCHLGTIVSGSALAGTTFAHKLWLVLLCVL